MTVVRDDTSRGASFRTEDAESHFPITPPLLANGTLFAARYEIGEPLGIGGYAVVYSARDRQLGIELAVKILRADRLSESTVRRFRREVRVARESQSDRLIRIFDIGESDGTLFLTMELAAGCLRDEIDKGPLSIDRVIEVALQTIEALSVLHGVGIVHRDLKPENLLVAHDGSIKLADFGLARHTDPTTGTQTDALVGTFEYLSPEQALGNTIDERSDLYSLGVLLFEMLTGDLPYSSHTSIGTLLAHVQQRPRAVRALRDDVPRWLESIVSRLLEKDLSRRYQSAAEVARDIRKQRAPRTFPRRRGIAAASLLAAFCLIAGGTSWAWHEYESTRFHALTSDVRSTRGLDRLGRSLWERPNRSFLVTVARILPEGKKVALTPRMPRDQDFRSAPNHEFSVLDLQSGEELRTIQFPVRSRHYPAFSDTFLPNAFLSMDLNADGWDEVAISFAHTPYWPSYTIVLDGRTGEFTEAIFASGHHSPVGAMDVDGDGRRELILMGPNNRMGWYGGIAAVRMPVDRSVVGLPVSTPDGDSDYGTAEDLVWYALVPAGSYTRRRLTLDENAGELRLGYPDGRVLTLDSNGFVRNGRKADPNVRQAARRSAYAHLRALNRGLDAGKAAEALRSADAAIAAAADAGDDILREWASRLRARSLIGLERYAEAEVVMRNLNATPVDASNAAWEAARAYHLAGRTDDAVRWYRTGYTTSDQHGRLKYEYLQGLVLALTEHERWMEASREIERFGRSIPNDSEGEWSRAFVTWRRSTRVDRMPISQPITDLHRYWDLEFRLARFERPEEVLSRLENALRITSEVRPLLESVRAEILARQGHAREAATRATVALQDAEAAAEQDPVMQSHLPVLRERARRLAP